MATFSTADLTNMRAAQVDHMMDVCVIQAVVQTLASDRELVDTWPTDGDELACGLDMRPGTERHGVDNIILRYDAVVRLPITATPAAGDRVKITERFGEELEFVEATTNLITNPSFETNTTGWAAESTSTIARSTAQAKFGSASLLVTYKGGSANAASFALTITDTQHEFSAWIYIPSGYDGSQIRIGDQGTFASATGSQFVDANMSLVDQWQRVSYDLDPDAGDLTGYIFLVWAGSLPSVDKFVYIDGVQCEAKVNPTPYCDGSLGKGYSWNGTPHASTSSRVGTELIFDVVGPIQRGPSGIRVMLNRIET